MTNIIPAVVVVGYNRSASLQRLLNSIANASYPHNIQIPLVISIDHADNAENVLKVANEFEWMHGEKRVIFHDKKMGLRKHIISCGDLTEEYGSVIILEDDLTVSCDYYNYTIQAYEYYSDDEHITGISLYSHSWNGYAGVHFIAQKNEYDTYLGQYSITWGQSWSQKWWRHFKEWYVEHEDKLAPHNENLPSVIEKWGNQSWGKYFSYYIVEKGLFYVVPYISLSTNNSEVGEHTRIADSIHQVMLYKGNARKYVFAPYRDAIKYDFFFERMFPHDYTIEGIPIDDICIDLNGTHSTNNKKRYVLSCKRIANTKIISSFGIALRPIENNIIEQTIGNSLYLYDLKSFDDILLKDNKNRLSIERIKYEFYGFSGKTALKYGIDYYLSKIQRKLRGN